MGAEGWEPPKGAEGTPNVAVREPYSLGSQEPNIICIANIIAMQHHMAHRAIHYSSRAASSDL